MKRSLITLLALVAIVTGGWAKTVVNVTGQTARVTQYSTLYVGEVVLDGQQSFYYLYSEDLNNSETVFAVVRDCLRDFKGGIFSTLVPDIIGQTDDKGVSVCSNAAFQSLMNSYWTDAYQAGLACLPNTGVASSSSNDLYQSDAAFAAKCTFEENADIIDDAGYSVTISGPLGKLTSTFTDDVTYSVDGGELVKHIDRHIDYTCEMVTVIYTKAELSSPLTFEALEDGMITVNLDDGVTFNPIQYNLNGTGWTDVTWNNPIDLAANDVICFRGDNGTCYATDEMNYWAGFHFEPSNPVYVYGNMMSLIDKDGFATNTTLTEPYTFFHLFQRSDYEPNTAILNHPTKDIVLPAITLTAYCYDGLFADAPNITRAPELPATTLADWCYSEMFSGTAITTAPKLPATTLADACYSDMFMNCTSLMTAPDLPAATLAEGCYSSMFAGCTSLNYVKCLATDISADYCTSDWMWNVAATGTFVKAEGMNDWTVGPDANGDVNGIPEGWTVEEYFDPYATPLTLEAATDGEITFNYTLSVYHDAELTDIEFQKNGGAWTTYTWNDPIAVVTGDKVAFRGNNDSYFGNGKGYESRISSTADVYVYGNVMSLINPTEYPTLKTLTGKDAFSHLFAKAGTNAWEFVSNTTIQNHPTKDLVLPATTLTNMCYMDMFAGCEGLTRAPALPATEMTVACYAEMFTGCANLTKAPALPTTTFTPYGQDPVTFEEYGSIDCYMSMFSFCENLTEAPELPATTLVHGVYQNMFQGCTSLERAPELPAPIVADNAYSYMFDGCTSLNYVKCLATEFLIDPLVGNTAEDNVMSWLNNVAATGTFVKAPSMNDWTIDSPNGIPAGWTVKNNLLLSNNTDNSGAINDAATSGLSYEVTLSDRTLYKDGDWNTLCLPFNLDATQLAASPLAGAEIREISSASISGNTLSINFTIVDEIIAGTPYIIKWASGENLVNPLFENVTVTSATNDFVSGGVTFKGTYEPITFNADNHNILFMGESNTLYWPKSGAHINAFRAYFQLADGSSANNFVLTFDDDDPTGIANREERIENSDVWYDLNGRKFNGAPKLKGIYIHNGKKVVIK